MRDMLGNGGHYRFLPRQLMARSEARWATLDRERHEVAHR